MAAAQSTGLASLSTAETFPALLLDNARRRGDKPAIREKDLGIWQTYTWAQVRDEIAALAAGLKATGVMPGDKVAIVGDNRPRLYWTMVAAQAIGAVPVPLYQDSVADEMKYVVDHAEVRVAVVEDQEQVDKLLQIKPHAPRLETIIFDDERGLRNYDRRFLHAFDAVQERGRALIAANPRFFEDAAAKVSPDDAAIILYTSGTTGTPKGVVLTHRNVIVTARNGVIRERLRADEEVMAYLPMAWVGDNLFSFGQCYVAGFCVNCPESSATVMADMREIGPTYFFAPPRIFENILTQVLIRMEDAGALKRRAFKALMDLARRVGPQVLDGKPVGLLDRLGYALGALLVYGPLKNTLGLSHVRIAYTAGEAIGPDIFLFYRSLGINLKQLYGMTEASVFITIQPDGQIRADTVGTPAIDVEIKIADSGEVLFRGPGTFREYYKNPTATAETKTPDGWVRTGDAGLFDKEGHLRIVDRAKDVGRLTGGALFAPKFIENKLKFFPHIKEAVAFGDKQAYVSCFINIDLQAVGSWAEKRGIAYASYQELAALDAVYDLVADEIRTVNRDLAADPQLAGSQVRRFLLLHKELDADDGELTRTRKVRRRFIEEKYAPLIGSLYSGKPRAQIETVITYEDGRKATMKADLRIMDVDPAEAAPMRLAS